jgi:phosphoglucosamine mutase
MEKRKSFFGTDGIRGRVGEYPITPDFVLKLGWAAGRVLTKYTDDSKVVIGKDTRISGYMFESALEAGLTAAGVNSYLVGPMPTPAIAYITQNLRAQAGIVISASHNPYYDNGIKIFSSAGRKLPDEVEFEIEQYLEYPIKTMGSELLGKATRVIDAPTRYIEYCKNTFPKELSLRNMKIVLDCANGATYHIAPIIFRELGAEALDIAAYPDGFNINDHCGSLHPEMLQETVLTERADLGIAFDGDGDRVLMVDHHGECVDGDELLFVIANHLNQKGAFKGGVVGTVMSNYGLETALRENNIDFVRAKVGDRYVLEELSAKNWILGGEPSGHIICSEVTSTGDGIVAALQVLSAMIISGRSLHELKCGMKKLPQRLINVPVKKSLNPDEYPDIQLAIQKAHNRLQNSGRVLLRPSGTEPLIRVMVEGCNLVEIDEIAEMLAQVVQKTLS